MATAGIGEKLISGFKWFMSGLKSGLQFVSNIVKKTVDFFNPSHDNFSEDLKEENCTVSLKKPTNDASVESSTTPNVVGSVSELNHAVAGSSLSALSKHFGNLLRESDKLFMVVEEILRCRSEAEAKKKRKYLTRLLMEKMLLFFIRIIF
ncbi:hypothetical protein CDL12_08834 [Handroanthus impetiginosus]|uniref:Uncharacterized protein n=1 Tax=Handroanthus impetiginosus TaxID=429701 RepID=A0A2G9HLU5_9LAMI|nr:hypothetical protein CDL12_08834 [Handroanthus impetiginosus]